MRGIISKLDWFENPGAGQRPYKDPSEQAAMRALEQKRQIKHQVIGVYQPLLALPSSQSLTVFVLLLVASQISLTHATGNRRQRRDEQFGLVLPDSRLMNQSAVAFFEASPLKHYSHKKEKKPSENKIALNNYDRDELEKAFNSEDLYYFRGIFRPGYLSVQDSIQLHNINTSLLMHAVRLRKNTLLNYFLQLNADPNWINDIGLSLLHVAAGYNTEAIEPLIKAGANPNIASKTGTTPLVVAITLNSESIAPLIENGANLEVAKDIAIVSAIRLNETKALKAILNFMEEINEQKLSADWEEVAGYLAEQTILPKKTFIKMIRERQQEIRDAQIFRQAIENDNVYELKSEFSQKSIQPFEKMMFSNADKSLEPLLFFCIRNIKIEIVRFLLEKKVNVNSIHNGQTILHYVAQYTPYLAHHFWNVDIFHIDFNGDTAFHIALKKDNVESIYPFLTTFNGKNPPGKNQITPLQLAASHYPHWVRLLLEMNTRNIDVPDEVNHTTPLLAAAEKGNDEAVKLLVEYGANVNAVDKNHMSALHFAATKNPALIPLLIEAGAKINARNHENLTPLLLAVKHGELAAAKHLLKAGASFDMDEVKAAFAKATDHEKPPFWRIQWELLELNPLKIALKIPNPLILMYLLFNFIGTILLIYHEKIVNLVVMPPIDDSLLFLNQLNTNLFTNEWQQVRQQYILEPAFTEQMSGDILKDEWFELLKNFLQKNGAKLSKHRGQWCVTAFKAPTLLVQKKQIKDWQQSVIEFIARHETQQIQKRLTNQLADVERELSDLSKPIETQIQYYDNQSIAFKECLLELRVSLDENQTNCKLLKKIDDLYAAILEKMLVLKSLHQSTPLKALQENYKDIALNIKKNNKLTIHAKTLTDKMQVLSEEIRKDRHQLNELISSIALLMNQANQLINSAQDNIKAVKAEKKRKQFLAAFAQPQPLVAEVSVNTKLDMETIAYPSKATAAHVTMKEPVNLGELTEKLPDAPYLLTEQRAMVKLPSRLDLIFNLTQDPKNLQASVKTHLLNIEGRLSRIDSFLKQTGSEHEDQLPYVLLYQLIRLFQSVWEISELSEQPDAWKNKIEKVRQQIVHAACRNLDNDEFSKLILESARKMLELTGPIRKLCREYDTIDKADTMRIFSELLNINACDTLPMLISCNHNDIPTAEYFKKVIEDALMRLRELGEEACEEKKIQTDFRSSHIKMYIVKLAEHWNRLIEHYPDYEKLLYSHLEKFTWVNKTTPATILERARHLRNQICHKDKIARNRRGGYAILPDISPATLLQFLNHIPASPVATDVLNPYAPTFTPQRPLAG